MTSEEAHPGITGLHPDSRVISPISPQETSLKSTIPCSSPLHCKVKSQSDTRCRSITSQHSSAPDRCWLVPEGPCFFASATQQIWFIRDHQRIPARESGPTCLIILRAFVVLIGECVSSSVICLPSLKALCEFYGLIWLFKSSFAGSVLLWVHGWLGSVWLSIGACLLVQTSPESAFYPLPLLICWCFFSASIFSSLVLSKSEANL